MIYVGATTTNVCPRIGQGGNLTQIVWPPGIELGPGRIDKFELQRMRQLSTRAFKKEEKFSELELCIRWGGVIGYIWDSKERDWFELPKDSGIRIGFITSLVTNLETQPTHKIAHRKRLFLVAYWQSHMCDWAVVPLCVYVSESYGVFMLFPLWQPLWQAFRVYKFTCTSVIYHTYVFPHMCDFAPSARERSI